MGVVFMTPETYLRHYHDLDRAEAAIPAEAVYPSCPLVENGCNCVPGNETPSDDCCCKASMAEALRLLCDSTLASLVNFDTFFFLTDNLTVGGALNAPTDAADNIADAAASFRRFAPCNCDLLDVNGAAYFAAPGGTAALESVDQISLCAVRAVAFQLLPEAPAEAGRAANLTPYQQAVRAIRRTIQAEGGATTACGSCTAHCNCDNCCCNAGILAELSTRNLSRLATLTVGPLVLQNVTVLGSLGSVLVLADETAERFYLVCVNNVEILG